MGTVHVINSVKIHLYSGEHNPPHIHAVYAEYEVLIVIATGEIIRGELPTKQFRQVQDWLFSKGVQKQLGLMFQNLNPRLRG